MTFEKTGYFVDTIVINQLIMCEFRPAGIRV
jgi:hypothetical protein